jgi:hypothetical protein
MEITPHPARIPIHPHLPTLICILPRIFILVVIAIVHKWERGRLAVGKEGVVEC